MLVPLGVLGVLQNLGPGDGGSGDAHGDVGVAGDGSPEASVSDAFGGGCGVGFWFPAGVAGG